MAQNQQKYDTEYKVQAVKLTKEIEPVKAAAELGVSVNTANDPSNFRLPS